MPRKSKKKPKPRKGTVNAAARQMALKRWAALSKAERSKIGREWARKRWAKQSA